MRTKRWQELLEKRNARIARRTRSSNWQLPTRSTINSTKAKPSQISKPKGTIDILLDTINGERSKLGLDSLVEHDILARVARSRIKLSIKSRTAVDVSSALESEGYMNVDIHTCNCSAWQYAAMEISAIQETPEGMLVTILADEKNTKRLLSSTYKDIGIALDDTRILIVLGAITFTPIEEFSADQQVQYKKDILELVNKERKQYELQPVKQSDLLEKAAQAHAQDMWDQKYFSHTSMDGRVLEQRIEATGYNTINFETCNCSSWSYRVGENIASGQKDPAAVMEGWMNSAGHRKNILTPEFNELGVGIIGNKWVQNFGVITLE